MDMIRVLLADDEPLIRAGLSTILQASGHITVVGEASTGQQAVTEAQRLHPDVICMDIRMPDGDGLEATRLIQQLNPTPAVIVITTFDLDEYVFGALEAGACGILLKDSPMDALVEGVQRAALGEGLVDAALTRRVITEFTRRKMTITPDTSTLTPRELDCVIQLCRGLSNNDIASELYLEPSTVKTHLSSAMSKTGAENRVQLVIWAFKNNIVS
ncbi:response regulator receiver domain protein [Corynebacterium durum F0235]|jgi:response regulator receiver domain protein|uniref:Response regulator receiver domain protein n=2 Tax=Corynebacterium durum TaxID=61592 RepID=L1MH90_9CORY|nr:response regulator receiver domain protein [Corynebacterium durum F0235]